MGWNDPNDEKPSKGKNGPPDLDELLKNLGRNLKSAFNKNTKSNKNNKFTPKDFINSSPNGLGVFFSMIFAMVLFLWVISGIFIVGPAEQAAIMRFGKYVETVGPGPHWIARFISSKIVVNVDRVSDYSYSAQMLTKDENLVSVAVAVQYRIGDLEQYLFSVADPKESLQQATSSALRQVVGTTTLDSLITEGREAWGINVQESLTKILNIYKTGIVIVNVSPQPARAPENVQDAFDDAIKAQEDEKRFKEQAQAYEAKVIPIAEGNAKRIYAAANADAKKAVLLAEGESAEFMSLLPEYLKAPQVTGDRLYLETMQNILSRSSKVLIANKAGNMIYLPLNQLSALNSNVQNSLINKNIEPLPNVKKTQDSDNSFMFDGRPIVRPTTRIERSDTL